MTERRSKDIFIKGTVILAVSGIVVKLLSAAYRIPLTRMIGAEGMGKYSAAFNIFMPFFSLAVAGITPTVSRLRAKCRDGDINSLVNIKKTAARCFGITSFLAVVAALIVSRLYSSYMGTPMIFTGVMLLCPNLIFATFEAIYKGISQGSMNMAVTAKASLLESGAKLLIGITSVYLAGVMVRENAGDAQLLCAFATISICGLICLLYMYTDFRKNYPVTAVRIDGSVTAKTLFSMSVPIAASALVVSLANFFDTVICLSIVKSIPDYSLMAAYPFISFSAEDEKAIWLFGVYQGLCLSVVNLIPSLSSAVGSSGLPLITRSLRSDDRLTVEKQTARLMNLTAFLVVPVSLFVTFFPGEVLTVLYGYRGAQTVLARYFLRFMAPVAILSAFTFPLNSVLHANGKSASILKILLFSCGIKVALSAYLCSQEQINIMGCIISQIVFHILVFVFSVLAVRTVSPGISIVKTLVMPVSVAYILLTFLRIFADFVLYTVPVAFKTFMCGGIFVVVYVTIFLFMGFFVDN